VRIALSTAPCSTKYLLISTKRSHCRLGLGDKGARGPVPHRLLHRRTLLSMPNSLPDSSFHMLSGGLLCATFRNRHDFPFLIKRPSSGALNSQSLEYGLPSR